LFQGIQTDKMGHGVCCELHRLLHSRMRKPQNHSHGGRKEVGRLRN